MRDILKSSAKVGFATIAGILASVVAGKVLALLLGAAGVGLYGLLRQLLQNLTLLGSFNGQTAIVQGIASRPNKSAQIRFSGSVLWIQVCISGSLAFLLMVGAPWIGPWLIPHPQAVALLRWLALGMIVAVAQAYVLGLLNGHRLINDLVKSQLLGPLATVLLIFPMIWLVRGGFSSGFLLMLAGPSALVMLGAARVVWRARLLPGFVAPFIDREDRAQFFRMSTILTIAGVIATGTQFSQSWLIARWMSLDEAGQFWTAWTLSMSYVTLVLGSLGTYYMPSLSKLEEPAARRSLIREYLHLVLVIMPILVSVVVVFKPWVIQGLFSSSMLPALKVMRWMLIGDYFKVVAYVFAFPMVAFNEMKWFFWTDVLFTMGMAIASWVWILSGGGIEGLGFIFTIIYLLYLFFVSFYIYEKHKFILSIKEVVQLVCGLLVILIISAFTWRDISVRLGSILLFVFLGGSYSVFTLRGVNWQLLLSSRKNN